MNILLLTCFLLLGAAVYVLIKNIFIPFPYFPFSYYAADQDILQDHEIQALANEISSEGLGNDGGKGKVIHTNNKFTTTFRARNVLKEVNAYCDIHPEMFFEFKR